MYDPKVHNLQKFKPLRKRLRGFGTEAERILWSRLKNNALGKKFRRQFGIGNYIVDFCCWKEMLVIEIDGSVHNDPSNKENDQVRQQDLENFGFRILRFTNSQVFNNIDFVVEKIKQELE